MKGIHGNRRQFLLFSDFRCIGRFTCPIKLKRTVAKKTQLSKLNERFLVAPLEAARLCIPLLSEKAVSD